MEHIFCFSMRLYSFRSLILPLPKLVQFLAGIVVVVTWICYLCSFSYVSLREKRRSCLFACATGLLFFSLHYDRTQLKYIIPLNSSFRSKYLCFWLWKKCRKNPSWMFCHVRYDIVWLDTNLVCVLEFCNINEFPIASKYGWGLCTTLNGSS